jgi:UDP-N-acetylglucosamine/UDP-N-acetylgalactosamine diphosphorylase
MAYFEGLDKDLYEAMSKTGQLHLVSFMNELSQREKQLLVNDLKQLDFADVNEFFTRTMLNHTQAEALVDANMQPVPVDQKGSQEKSSANELASYESDGLKAIAENKVAVILLAGGQGTRLGVDYPKGMYSVDLLSRKTLYQLQAERLIKVKQLADAKFNATSSQTSAASIPWYIMTSEATKESTADFFREHNYFGLDKDSIVLFEQGMLPCLTKEGKIILDEKFKVSKAPDGNGGIYRALAKKGILDDMAKRGVEYVQVYCVDNILVKMADPVFTGFCIQKNANCAAKVVKKTDPEEKVGVICKVNNKFQVVEYSEISEKCRNLREKETDELVFNAGNICNHFFRKDFLDAICTKHERELKHHIAEKKIAYVDEQGQRVSPKQVNGIKLEKFVFDVFPFSDKFVIWEVCRQEEFAPLKNGYDASKENPVTCKQNLYAQHYRWLKNAGAAFDRQEE